MGKYFKDVERNMIYKVSMGSVEQDRRNPYMEVNLDLVCGWDYTDIDNSDTQGWCSPNNFTEDVQYLTHVCYVLDESVTEMLLEVGFECFYKPSDIKQIVFE